MATVGQLEMRIKQGVELGSISSSQAEQILGVLDYRLQHSLQNIRSALKTVPPDAS